MTLAPSADVRGQVFLDAQQKGAPTSALGDGQLETATHSMYAITERITRIRQLYYLRDDVRRPRLTVDNQIYWMNRKYADERTEDREMAMEALLVTRKGIAKGIAPMERRLTREMERAARALPVWPWVEGIRGVGAPMLAEIVAEAATTNIVGLDAYANPAKLWKRFGLGFYMGERQCRRRVEGGSKAERAAAVLAMAYSPKRRAVAYVLAMGLRNRNKGEYRAYYDEVKAKAIARGWDLEKRKWPPSNRAESHAMRLLAKRFLRDLWREWKRCSLAQDGDGEGHSRSDRQRTTASRRPE